MLKGPSAHDGDHNESDKEQSHITHDEISKSNHGLYALREGGATLSDAGRILGISGRMLELQGGFWSLQGDAGSFREDAGNYRRMAGTLSYNCSHLSLL